MQLHGHTQGVVAMARRVPIKAFMMQPKTTGPGARPGPESVKR